jgi:2-polyprenyl-3-methyl-5-hydroxy-6-metoxy-1,4-benzoquinol methylase
MSESAERVAKTWRDHWKESDMRPDRSFRGRLLRRYIAATGGLSASRFILKVVQRHAGDLNGMTVLDAGAGTGLNSLALARRGARVTLLDVAPEALEMARSYFEEQGLAATTVEGSIFSMPFADATFDLVWNTGVIEHFEPEERRLAVREMLRVVKTGGLVLTINPNAAARIYRFAKRRAEERGTWDVGFELPIETLRGDIDPNLHELEEHAEGWFMQFHFLKYLLPKPLRLPFVAAHELAQNVVGETNRFPGYLLTSVIRKRAT